MYIKCTLRKRGILSLKYKKTSGLKPFLKALLILFFGQLPQVSIAFNTVGYQLMLMENNSPKQERIVLLSV